MGKNKEVLKILDSHEIPHISGLDITILQMRNQDSFKCFSKLIKLIDSEAGNSSICDFIPCVLSSKLCCLPNNYVFLIKRKQHILCSEQQIKRTKSDLSKMVKETRYNCGGIIYWHPVSSSTCTDSQQGYHTICPLNAK